jgi:hypothetical protein
VPGDPGGPTMLSVTPVDQVVNEIFIKDPFLVRLKFNFSLAPWPQEIFQSPAPRSKQLPTDFENFPKFL